MNKLTDRHIETLECLEDYWKSVHKDEASRGFNSAAEDAKLRTESIRAVVDERDKFAQKLLDVRNMALKCQT